MQNLLFITIDDFLSLSAWPIYDGIAQTPNLDALQARSTTFDAAFADVALCNPSRAAILTGKSPWDTGILTNNQDWRHHVDPGTETLPGMLKSAGMYTAVGGKVFHTFPTENPDAVMDELISSLGLRNSSAPEFASVNGVAIGTTDAVLSDDVLVDNANAFMANYDGDAPFALFAGIYRPHADWIIPQEYIDLYDGIDVPIPDFVDDTDRAQFLSALPRPFHDSVVEAGMWQDLVKYYLASLSYADAKLGELLDGLEASGHVDNTITMVMSDHGYHLGDADLWHKFSTYEQSARAPLVISVPGDTPRQVDVPVNLSSVAATVLDLLDVPVPEGISPSLTGYLDDSAEITGNEYALTWMRGSVSVRTIDYRYTLYENGEEELFDINADIMNENNLATDLPEITAAHKLIALSEIGDDLFIRPEADVHGTAENSVYYLYTSDVEITDDGGTDSVYYAGSYTLQDNLENLYALDTEDDLTLIGNALANQVTGALDNDRIFGLGGSDSLFGASGHDTLSGGSGDDFLVGGAGHDDLNGGSGNDRLEGEFGNDTLKGGEGNDSLHGSAGNDTLFGHQGKDYLDGSAGNDRLFGNEDDDVLIGGAGWDYLNGGFGIDKARFSGASRDYSVHSGTIGDFRIGGVDGRDTLISIELLEFDDVTMLADDFFVLPAPQALKGTTGGDTIHTARGADFVVGRAGDDVLCTFGGDDSLRGGSGDDVLDGGSGIDTAIYQGATASVEVYLNFGMSHGAAGSDKLVDIENVLGARFNDKLVGNHFANTLEGGRGDDLLRGWGGHDKLIGGQGNDTLEGGGGNDVLQGAQGADWLYGGDGADALSGGIEDDFIFGGTGADTLLGDDGNDTLFGEMGNDILSGGNGDDALRGNLGADRLLGGRGADNMRGGEGDDVLRGQSGNDALFGEAGRDKLHGNIGDDMLFGGSGGGIFDGEADEFIFAPSELGFGGVDRIRDFEDGIDKIDLSRFDFTSFWLDVMPLAFERGGGQDMALVFEEGYVAYIDNFTLAQFDISDVIL